jgi:hypothetical protein
MSINIGRDMIGSGIQQGSHGAKQTVTFNALEVGKSLTTFEVALASAGLPADDFASVSGDLAWIRAQLKKPEPDVGLIRQIGRSARNVTEAVSANGLTAALAAAGPVLWAALGI